MILFGQRIDGGPQSFRAGDSQFGQHDPSEEGKQQQQRQRSHHDDRDLGQGFPEGSSENSGENLVSKHFKARARDLK